MSTSATNYTLGVGRQVSDLSKHRVILTACGRSFVTSLLPGRRLVLSRACPMRWRHNSLRTPRHVVQQSCSEWSPVMQPCSYPRP